MDNEFDFGDLSGFGLDSSDDDGFDIGQPQDSQPSGGSDFGDFGDFGTDQGDNGGQQLIAGEIQEGDKSAIIKQGAIIVAVAIMVIVIGFSIVKWLTGGSKDKTDANNTPANNTQQTVVQQPVQSSTSQTNGWTNITDAKGLRFNDTYVSAVFTITGINHYAKVVDAANNLEIKSVLTGNISGYQGTYEVEVPYSKGIQLSTGMVFNVKVQVGEFNGKVVIGEIDYS